MKKILLTTAAVAAFSTSAFADMPMGEDSFYLRADVTASKFNKSTAYGMSHKNSKSDMGIGAGVGYRVMDNMRAELVYNYAFSPKFKHSEANYNSKVKVNAGALMAKGLVDFADLGVAKLYAGAGLGWAQVGAKFTDNGYAATKQAPFSSKAKTKNNLAWALYLGSGFSVADGVTLDVAYSFTDLGKTKPFAASAGYTPGKVTVRAHNLSAGVRFDI